MSTFRRSLTYLAKYRTWFFVAIVMSSVAAMATPSLGYIMQFLVDRVMGQKSLHDLRIVVMAVIGVFAVKGIGNAISRYMMFSIGHSVTYELRRDIYAKLVRLPLSYFAKTRTGQIMSRATTDVPLIQGIMIQLHHCATDSLRVLFSVTYLVYLHASLTMSIFLIAPPVTLAVRFISGRLRRIGKIIQSRLGDINSSLQETILGIREIKAFGAEENECGRFDRINRDNLKMNIKGAKYQSLNSPVLELLIACAMSLVLWLGTKRVIAGELTPGEFLGYLAVLGQIFDPMKRLVDVFNNIKLSLAAFDRIFEFLDTENPIRNRAGAVEIDECKGQVAFDTVSFAYDGDNERTVLRNIDFVAETGKVTAIVGPSGAGKSTLVNLLPRFFDVDSGRILLDGTDIRSISLESLRRQFGMVPQETILFSGTVRDNIAMGRPDAKMDDIVRAARDANAHSFIEELPDGYDTQIGERGVKLSGGQRQRIAIARAILKNPRILILDEATSSLDTDSEKLVQEALERLMRNRTTLVIAHRLSTVTGADLILVLDRGRIVQRGTHEELSTTDGLYKRLCTAQFQTGHGQDGLWAPIST